MSIWTSFKRITKGGFVSFWRNGFLSFATILTITIALSVISSLLLFNIIANNYLTAIKDKVDINVYFTTTAKEDAILTFQKTVNAIPEVSKTEYVSKEKALEDFKARNADNSSILAGLDEVGDNPLSAVLNIKAKNPEQYSSISKFLESKAGLADDGGTIIKKITYNENKTVIDRLAKIIKVVEQVGVGLSIILALTVILVTLNTMRLVIYSAKDEISVMKLVGASNMHVRGPFVVAGIFSGAISAILTTAIMYPATYYFGKVLRVLSPDFSLNAYYLAHVGEIFIVVLVIGSVLGAISSYISVRRYLNV